MVENVRRGAAVLPTNFGGGRVDPKPIIYRNLFCLSVARDLRIPGASIEVFGHGRLVQGPHTMGENHVTHFSRIFTLTRALEGGILCLLPVCRKYLKKSSAQRRQI